MWLIAAVMLVVTPAAGAQSPAAMAYAEAKARADRDEASLTPAQQTQLISSQGKAGGDAHATCFANSGKPDPSPYTVVMELDASGKVVRTWLDGKSALAICFDQQMAKSALFVPPHVPFYTSFEMTWRR